MRLRPGFLLLLLGLSACQALAARPYEIAVADKTADRWARHTEGDIRLSIAVPAGWESYNTGAGIVLNEHMGTGTPDQPLRGFLIHIFVPNMGNFRLPEDGENLAWYVLMQVVKDPAYVGNAVVSAPMAFEWDQHDAAYYLLDNQDGTVTMLLALGLADHTMLVVSHVSVPVDQSSRIPDLLPDLLNSLTIDGVMIDASALRELPASLNFPTQ